MGQQDDDYYGDYLDTINTDSSSNSSQDGTLPLPTTDDSSGGNVQMPDVNGQIDDSFDKIMKGSLKKSGEAAATRDFQQAHGNGWEYDADTMKKQIEQLEDLHNETLKRMQQHTKAVVDIPPPAKEKVSEDFVKYVNKSGKSHNDQFEKYREYVKGYIDTLHKIDKLYQNKDEEAAQELLSKDV